MGSRGKTKEKPKPAYDLDEVKEKVRKGNVFLHQKALDGARESFGWGEQEIRDAVLNLEAKHFYKSETFSTNAWLVLDVYKARGVLNEDVYAHFYIDDEIDMLIINSFKEI